MFSVLLKTDKCSILSFSLVHGVCFIKFALFLCSSAGQLHGLDLLLVLDNNWVSRSCDVHIVKPTGGNDVGQWEVMLDSCCSTWSLDWHEKFNMLTLHMLCLWFFKVKSLILLLLSSCSCLSLPFSSASVLCVACFRRNCSTSHLGHLSFVWEHLILKALRHYRPQKLQHPIKTSNPLVHLLQILCHWTEQPWTVLQPSKLWREQ